MATAPAAPARTIYCQSSPIKRRESPATRIRVADTTTDSSKIVLQPRLSNLRSYGDGSISGGSGARGSGASPFFSSLAEYVENSRKSRDFETLSGRLAMVAFAVAVGVEFVTGNSLFRKLEAGEIEEASALCAMVVAAAATFACVTSAKTRIKQMFTIGCNNFVDGVIDELVNGLFYDDDLDDSFSSH